MKKMWTMAAAFAGVLAVATAGFGGVTGVQAQEKTPDHKDVPYQGITADQVPLPASSADILGRAFTFPEGTPNVGTYVITIQPGVATELHKHEVPLIAYMLSGVLEVDYGTKGKKVYKAGDAFIEAIEWCHSGHAVGPEPAKLLGIYLGNEKLKNVINCPK